MMRIKPIVRPVLFQVFCDGLCSYANESIGFIFTTNHKIRKKLLFKCDTQIMITFINYKFYHKFIMFIMLYILFLCLSI